MKNKKLIRIWMQENNIKLNETWTLFHENDYVREEICKVKVIKDGDEVIVFEHSYLYNWQPMAFSLLGAMIFCEDFTLEKV